MPEGQPGDPNQEGANFVANKEKAEAMARDMDASMVLATNAAKIPGLENYSQSLRDNADAIGDKTGIEFDETDKNANQWLVDSGNKIVQYIESNDQEALKLLNGAPVGDLQELALGRMYILLGVEPPTDIQRDISMKALKPIENTTQLGLIVQEGRQKFQDGKIGLSLFLTKPNNDTV